MDTKRLHKILKDTTVRMRVNEEREGVEKVDVHFFVMAFDKARALSHREEFLTLLKEWPTEAYGGPVPALVQGPSYIHAGAVLDSQEAALQMFALGKAMDVWEIITPEILGFMGGNAARMAESGYVMIVGFNP